ncbi:MAG: LysM peptidoglycan-binding domain-containing protein [Flavisolibacter sp.]|nr:LysM peptidoglycan-binding domain-containing protein [Flavisolibacter sp.]
MKKFFFVAILFLSSFAGYSQLEFLVQNSDKGLYLNHTVTAKETLYSLGRLYNLHPRDIAAYNSLDMNSGLNIGQSVRIPLKDNFSQSSNKGIPVYYVVGEKEGLYRVSQNNNNVLMANLRQWNRLASDNLSVGQKLIVGYITNPDASNVVAATPKNDPPPVVEQPRPRPAENANQRTQETQPTARAVNTASQQRVNDASGGFFKPQFEQQVRSSDGVKEQSGMSGIFKTSSGWEDGKYYALMDGIEPGSIVRIINPLNNKAVYAKVLGAMTGIRQNAGLDIRISNAAANSLNIADTEKFIVKVHF